MKNRLLNFSKNLIISIGLVVMVMILFFTTSTYATSGDTLGKLMRETVSGWYNFVLKVSLIVYVIAYLIIIIKLLGNRTPDRMAIIKESLLRFFIMYMVIYFLHLIMIAILTLNAEGIEAARAVGTSFSGIDMKEDEYNLYETALSKAYEISAVPGFIGLVMYLLLVYYTYKFAIVYAKRYINVIILILLGPIIFVLSTIKRIIGGVSDGRILKWFKEFIFNVVIQVLHAMFYAILIGLTLKMSENDENLVGALLTLILFGFIFKIDSIVRVIFNAVGGSTKISSSKAMSKAIDVTGGAVNAGLGALSGGVDKFGKDLDEKGLKDTFADYGKSIGDKAGKTWDNTKIKFKNVGNFFSDKDYRSQQLSVAKTKAWDKTKELGLEAKDKALTGFENAKTTAKTTFEKAKSGYGDVQDMLTGEKTVDLIRRTDPDAIVEQQHIMDEKKGLEALRQGVQGVGIAINKGIKEVENIGKYTGNEIKKMSKFAVGRVKKGVTDAYNEYKSDVERLESNYEMVKRISKVTTSTVKERLFRKKKYIKNKDGLNVDVNDIMMLVVDSDTPPEELIRELKERYGDNIDVEAFVFEKVGAQAFLSPTEGSPIMGMSVLAEAKYEEKAEHKIDNLLNNGKASRRKNKKALKKAKKSVKKDKLVDKHSKVKTYKFSRFNPNTARKITNRMLKKVKNENKYLVAINKTYTDMQINNVKPRGVVSKKTSELKRTFRIKRKHIIKTVTNMKMTQMTAIKNYKQLAKQARGVELANNVGGTIMGTKNMIKLSFKSINHMTAGQIGLRNMIREGSAKELGCGLFAIRKKTSIEDKVKLTGVVNQENQVVQFVVNKSGELTRQVVSSDGKIIEPAPELKELNSVVDEVASREVIQHVVTVEGKIVEQVISQDNAILTERFQVVDNEGETLANQISSVITNSDLGLQEDATIDDKLNKFESLLQDLKTQPLLDQVLKETNEEQKAVDETIFVGMQETKISSVDELKRIVLSDDKKDEEIRKSFEKAVTDHMVDTGIVTLKEAEDEDIVGNALDILNERVNALNANDSDLLETAANMERVRVAEELLNMGQFTPEQPPTDTDIDDAIDNKVVKLSDLLVNLSKEALEVPKPLMEEAIKFPRQVLVETFNDMSTVLDRAAEGTISPEELAYEKELMKAEKRWAKAHGTDADASVVERIMQKERGEDEGENAAIKITLKFFGGVEQQGQVVILSNRYSIKDFYDKAKKLETANMKKTQERFLQVYGGKLAEMQLEGFTFAKNPVKDMDGWSIYVVTDEENISIEDEKKKKPEDIAEDNMLEALLEEYFDGIAEIFAKFVEEKEIETFDDLFDTPDIEGDLVTKLRMFFFRHGESNSEAKAQVVVDNIDEDIRFREILREVNANRIAAQKTKDSKANIQVVNKEQAEEQAESSMTADEIEKSRTEEKIRIGTNAVENAVNTGNDAVEAAKEEVDIQATEEISRLLDQINLDYVEIKNNSKEKKKVIDFNSIMQ